AENCEILAVYGLLGAYDLMSVVECPDNRAAMKIAAKIGNLIGAKTETMPALDRDDFLQLLTEL
ncbi:MAG TPA: GYD domain-containing protein, partial [Acidimicrobiia bacterium]|nr:GYD domain-containing protein [Acidimicrobiia bacterium]